MYWMFFPLYIFLNFIGRTIFIVFLSRLFSFIILLLFYFGTYIYIFFTFFSSYIYAPHPVKNSTSCMSFNLNKIIIFLFFPYLLYHLFIHTNRLFAKLYPFTSVYSSTMINLDLDTIVRSAIAATESSISVILVLLYGYLANKSGMLSESGEKVWIIFQ